MSTHWPLQSVVPVGHEVAHELSAQTWPLGQALPQAPQFAGSDVVSTHLPPQRAKPASHCRLHWPPLQIGVPLGSSGHALPHAPQ